LAARDDAAKQTKLWMQLVGQQSMEQGG